MGRKPRPEGAKHVVTNTVKRGEREYHSHLLRRSYREGGKVKKETLANLSHLDDAAIELLRRHLRGETLVSAEEAFKVERSLPAGHVEAALVMARRLELERVIERSPSRERERCLAMILARVLSPGSKLATVRSLSQTTLGSELDIAGSDSDDLYAAMDWLAERQPKIEDRLAKRHLRDATLVLYDVSSSYFEGSTCPLAARGYSRDRKRGTLQVTYGLVCSPEGRPLAIELFEGQLHDDKTVPAQITKLKERFGLETVVLVSDRGMVTKANLELLRQTAGAAWITALKAPQVKKLVKDGALQLSLFDEANLAEITDEESYPGERLIVCRNPLVAQERRRKRDELLAATERGLAEIKARVKAGTLQGAAAIGLAVGPALKRFRVKKHFSVEITDTSFRYERKEAQIGAEAALDGFYVLRTSVKADELGSAAIVSSYKQLKEVERAFRTLKGPLEIRPIHHRLEERVRAHAFLCMLAYYLEWHLREAFAPLTFKDECPPTQADPVAKARRSEGARRKAQRGRSADKRPCHSFVTLLAELALRTRNTIRVGDSEARFEQLTEPSEVQARALELAREAPVVA
ncbi:MAG: IS1634 family transposase [Actinobacteria bacterium]|nr:IS1634 family transposase [Actinomycetota bacterium]